MTDALSKKLSASKTIEKKGRTSPSPSAKKLLEKEADEGKQVAPTSNDAAYNVKHPTGDKMRDKVRSLLTNAIFRPGEDVVSSRGEAEIVANAIEHAMFVKFDGNGAPYKQKYRNISFNLKDAKNQKLRAAVLLRHLSPDDLLDMSNEELANDDLRKKREEVHEKMTREAMPYNKQEATTDMFKCGKCKERKCTYYQMQTRSADEPLTTFVTCVNCNNRWRF